MKKKFLHIFILVALSIWMSGYPLFVAAATNVLTNPGNELNNGTGWTNIVNGGSGWGWGGARTGSYGFASSYNWCSMDQLVDLVAAGYTASTLDEAPAITFRIWIMQRFDHNGNYYLEYKLLGEDGSTVVTSSLRGSQSSPIFLSAGTNWFQEEYTFEEYGTGVRYAYIKIAGEDSTPNWGGQYGPYFDDAYIGIASNYQVPEFSEVAYACTLLGGAAYLLYLRKDDFSVVKQS